MKGKYTFQDGKFVPLSEAKPPPPKVHTIMTDEMPETKHPGDGRIYTSRAKFNEATRLLGYESYSPNESDKSWEADTSNYDEDVREDVEAAIAKLRYGEGLTDDERELCRMRDKREDWEAES